MIKSILIVFIIVLLYFFTPRRPMPFIEITSKEAIKEVLQNTQSKDHDKWCEWYYGDFQEYHIFELKCIPNINPSSFFTIEKRYKIKKTLLKIDDSSPKGYAKISSKKERTYINIKEITIYWSK